MSYVSVSEYTRMGSSKGGGIFAGLGDTAKKNLLKFTKNKGSMTDAELQALYSSKDLTAGMKKEILKEMKRRAAARESGVDPGSGVVVDSPLPGGSVAGIPVVGLVGAGVVGLIAVAAMRKKKAA